MNTRINTLVLFAVTLVVCGVGYYLTEIRQPATLEHLSGVDRVGRLQHAQVAQLLAEAEQSSDLADQSVRKWNSRYRFIPTSLSTPDVIEYLEDLTPDGFEAFDVRLEEAHASSDVDHYTFSVEGTGYFENLYDFVWQIENNADFYRIRDLSMTRATVFDDDEYRGRGREMVRFTMMLDVYHGGLDGLSTDRENLASVSAEYRPAQEMPHDAFRPLVRERIRRTGVSQSGRVDVRHASLISIAGSRAIFQDGTSQFILYEGSPVANGTIVKIDPINVFVRASLTIDGSTEVFDIQMENARPSFRQAEGNAQLVPVETGN